jgi:hypothetical protein
MHTPSSGSFLYPRSESIILKEPGLYKKAIQTAFYEAELIAFPNNMRE